MKKLIIMAAAIFGAHTAQAMDWDGCYLPYKPSVPYPAVCLQGTNEEGISGSGATLAFIEINPDEILQCSKTSKIEMSETSATVYVDGKVAIEFSNVEGENDKPVRGDAKISGKSQGLKFGKLSSDITQRLQKKVNDDPNCQ